METEVGCVWGASFRLEHVPEAPFSCCFHHFFAVLSTISHLPAMGLCPYCLPVISDPGLCLLLSLVVLAAHAESMTHPHPVPGSWDNTHSFACA